MEKNTHINQKRRYKNKHRKRRTFATAKMIEEMATDYLNGATIREAAKRVDLAYTTGYTYLNELGIVRTKTEQKIGSRNPMWKGNEVGYIALHQWIKKRLPKPQLCSICKKRPPYDLANKSQQYKRDISDWEWICRSCHMKKDGRIYNLKQFQK